MLKEIQTLSVPKTFIGLAAAGLLVALVSLGTLSVIGWSGYQAVLAFMDQQTFARSGWWIISSWLLWLAGIMAVWNIFNWATNLDLAALTSNDRMSPNTFQEHAVLPQAMQEPDLLPDLASSDPHEWQVQLAFDPELSFADAHQGLKDVLDVSDHVAASVLFTSKERGIYTLWSGKKHEVQHIARQLKAHGLNVNIIPGAVIVN